MELWEKKGVPVEVVKGVVVPTAATFTTTLPTAFNGVYCRGAACQYRATTSKMPHMALGSGSEDDETQGAATQLEFCRGLGCPRKRGWPSNAPLDEFALNCAHLFANFGSGLKGNAFTRKAGEVHASFMTACKARVGMMEAGECPRYADVFLAALAPKIDQVTVGETKDVCTDAYFFVKSVKQAQIDLQLITVPVAHATVDVADAAGAVMLKQFSDVDAAGPCSKRGQAWHQWNLRRANHAPFIVDDVMHAPSYVQESSQGGLSNCSGTAVARPQGQTMYQIKPGSPDGQVPPIEISGTMFLHCVDQMSEITEATPQSAPLTVAKAKNWCNWQASSNRPEWDVQTCVGIAELLAFAVRTDLGSSNPVSPQQVCKSLFLATGTVHRVEQIVTSAWRKSTRGAAPTGPVPPSDKDADVKEWLDGVSRSTEAVHAKLQAQQAAIDTVNDAKKAVEKWQTEVHSMKAGPVFPDSSDFKPASNKKLQNHAFLATRVWRLPVVIASSEGAVGVQ